MMNQGLFRVGSGFYEVLDQSLLGLRVALGFNLCLSTFGFGFNYLGLRLLKVG